MILQLVEDAVLAQIVLVKVVLVEVVAVDAVDLKHIFSPYVIFTTVTNQLRIQYQNIYNLKIS